MLYIFELPLLQDLTYFIKKSRGLSVNLRNILLLTMKRVRRKRFLDNRWGWLDH